MVFPFDKPKRKKNQMHLFSVHITMHLNRELLNLLDNILYLFQNGWWIYISLVTQVLQATIKEP